MKVLRTQDLVWTALLVQTLHDSARRAARSPEVRVLPISLCQQVPELLCSGTWQDALGTVGVIEVFSPLWGKCEKHDQSRAPAKTQQHKSGCFHPHRTSLHLTPVRETAG